MILEHRQPALSDMLGDVPKTMILRESSAWVWVFLIQVGAQRWGQLLHATAIPRALRLMTL